MFGGDGSIKIIDFGFAMDNLCLNKGVAGTIVYMAPEILRLSRDVSTNDE